MNTTPLPTLKDVRDVLALTMGRDCEVTLAEESVSPATQPGVVVGVYVSQFLRAEAVIAFDKYLAATLGAAIALIPPATAARGAGAGPLPENLLENTSEVLNVMSSLFNVEDAPHLRLEQVYDSGDGPLPGDVLTRLRSYGPRLDLDVEVQGYSGGLMGIVLR